MSQLSYISLNLQSEISGGFCYLHCHKRKKRKRDSDKLRNLPLDSQIIGNKASSKDHSIRWTHIGLGPIRSSRNHGNQMDSCSRILSSSSAVTAQTAENGGGLRVLMIPCNGILIQHTSHPVPSGLRYYEFHYTHAHTHTHTHTSFQRFFLFYAHTSTTGFAENSGM